MVTRLLVGTFLWMVFLSSGCVLAENEQISDASENPNLIVIRGKISVKGSEPHTWLNIRVDSKTSYQLEGDFNREIRKRYQHSTLSLKGEIMSKSAFPSLLPVLKVHEIISTR